MRCERHQGPNRRVCEHRSVLTSGTSGRRGEWRQVVPGIGQNRDKDPKGCPLSFFWDNKGSRCQLRSRQWIQPQRMSQKSNSWASANWMTPSLASHQLCITKRWNKSHRSFFHTRKKIIPEVGVGGKGYRRWKRRREVRGREKEKDREKGKEMGEREGKEDGEREGKRLLQRKGSSEKCLSS